MKTSNLKVEITLTQPILGSLPANKQIFEDFIATKAPEDTNIAEEIASVRDMTEKGTTIFAKDDEGLFLWDYQFKGFLKEAIGVLTELGDTSLSKWTFKRVVDSCIFLKPRKIKLLDAQGNQYKAVKTFCERPLRAETMQGERIALARSEQLPEGTKLFVEIALLESSNAKSKFKAVNEDLIRNALDYGKLKGLGQWRSSSMGQFTWKEVN
jgi:hypothetical protein